MGGFVLTLAAFGALAAAAVYVGPRVIEARSREEYPAATPARVSDHQQVLELFSAMIARSRAVLAVHDRGPTPYEEIVLWLDDQERPGRLDASEIGIISHSRILQTITFYRLERGKVGTGLLANDWRDAAFCTDWRTSPEVHGTVVAAGISDLDFSREAMIQGGDDALRITFTWASETADGSDTASTVVDIARNQDMTGGAGVPET